MDVERFFWILFVFVIAQRLFELILSKSHAGWMHEHGGYEVGGEHFKWVILMMVFFFIALPVESFLRKTSLSPYWPILLVLFLLAQGLRYWAMISLGKFWNVRIWIKPGATRVVKGPYRLMRHPIYAAVAVELFCLPIMMDATITAFISLIGFAFFLRMRIPAEERALKLLVPNPK